MTILHESPEYYIQQCSECGAVLKYSKNDILVAYKEHYLGDHMFVADVDHIYCPCCKTPIQATKEYFYQFMLKNLQLLR